MKKALLLLLLATIAGIGMYFHSFWSGLAAGFLCTYLVFDLVGMILLQRSQEKMNNIIAKYDNIKKI